MVVIAVIAVLLVATVCVNALITRRAGRADAIERHERALDALRDLSEHPRPQPEFPHPAEPPTDHIRILEHRPQMARPPRTHTKRAAVSHRAGPRPRIDAPAPPPATAEPVPAVLSFDDASPPSPPPHQPEPAYALPPPSRRRRWSGRSGRAALVAAAAAVTVVFVALVVGTAFTPSHHGDHTTEPVRRAVEPPVTRPPVTAPPSTVALAPAQLLVSPTGNGTVTVRSPYALTLTTNGPCWVSIKDSTGRTVFEGTLQAGQRQNVPSAGPVDVRLGNTPVAQLMVNGAPLDLSRMSEVATLHFVAAA
jgi:hypothetical protein